nr:serine acetyltransferase [Opitutaceae bacterium]
MTLDDIKQALLASYERDGGINHLDGVNLPTQDSVQQLASDYMHLIFPGFFEATCLTKQEVPALVEGLLKRVERRLVTEIEK